MINHLAINANCLKLQNKIISLWLRFKTYHFNNNLKEGNCRLMVLYLTERSRCAGPCIINNNNNNSNSNNKNSNSNSINNSNNCSSSSSSNNNNNNNNNNKQA